MTDDKYLSKIAKLLRQAESTTNEAEAEAFMQAAQRLATATAISLEVARQHQADTERRQTPIQKQIVIGKSGKHGLKHYVSLFLAIAGQNDVTCNIAHNSTYVIAFGFPSDIEVVETLYASLVVQMVQASDKYLRSGKYKAELVWRPVYANVPDYWGSGTHREVVDYAMRPVDGRVARASFQRAFANKIDVRLRAARLDAIDEATARETPNETASSGVELVLANKAVEVADFYQQHSTARGSWRGNRSSGHHSSRAWNAGTEAGERARLGGEKAIGSGQRQVASGR